ncbi:MAG: sigma-54-dependent Fis family transcriptional regulator [Deltaproteobacteria bacterium]|nr:sigma-54-dependent Fis family transcriptional regulator [Deltaproteobacteria bacterium]
MIFRVLLALRRKTLQARIKRALDRPDVIVSLAEPSGDLLTRAAREICDLAVLDRRLLQGKEAMIETFQQIPDAPSLVLLSEHDDPAERAELLAAGCEAVLYAGLNGAQIASVLQTILDKRREISRQQIEMGHPLARPRLNDFVSLSPAMQSFMDMVSRVVSSGASLLIQGETGVGKERLARAIHNEGPRSDGPFIAVNCGALPESLLESELFGHEEGSFTGATRSRRGSFELAHRGSVFLDEIGEMPHRLQVLLLRVLQDHTIQRVGGERSFQVDVRVMAATNRDLETMVEAKTFRRDLYYRLSVVALTIPPLRERREDIPELVKSYIDYLRPRIGREVTSIRPEALEALRGYSWPGNVRELINVMERAMLLCQGDRIELHDLPRSISGVDAARLAALEAPGPREQASAWLDLPLQEARQLVLERFEKAYLEELLRRCDGRVGRTADRAGITPRALYDKMKRYGLSKEDYR